MEDLEKKIEDIDRSLLFLIQQRENVIKDFISNSSKDSEKLKVLQNFFSDSEIKKRSKLLKALLKKTDLPYRFVRKFFRAIDHRSRSLIK